MKKLLLLFSGLVALTCFSCKDDILSYAEQLAVDKALIDAYLVEKGINVDSTQSGLRYVITDLGNNDNIKPVFGSTVTVKYKGYLLDGTIFDQTTGGELLQLAIGNISPIPGFREALYLLNKNGKGTFFLPSGLAYGTNGSGPDIPPNTPLIFEIELVDFF
jgi:FKBP-type peptidyl-prolyl cis-trans isomerase FkpA